MPGFRFTKPFLRLEMTDLLLLSEHLEAGFAVKGQSEPSHLLVPSRFSTFLRSSLFSLVHVSTLWPNTSTAGSPSDLNFAVCLN